MTIISDVALLKRLRASSEWFRWMSAELLLKRGVSLEPPDWLSGFDVRTVDASVVSEPGSTGTDWRLHYSIKLYSLQCDQFLITRQETGESFLNFDIRNNDLLIGDRAYGRLKGMKYVRKNGGHYLTRLKNKAFKMYDQKGNEIGLPDTVRNLLIGKVRDIDIRTVVKDNNIGRMRLCIIRKTDEKEDEAMKKAMSDCSKKQRRVCQETIGLHRYIILATSYDILSKAYDIYHKKIRPLKISPNVKNIKHFLLLTEIL